jgi:hypothetical protein
MLKDIHKLILGVFESTIRTRIFCILGVVIFSGLDLPNLLNLIFDTKEFFKDLFSLKDLIPIFWISYSVFCLPAYLLCVFGTIRPIFLKNRLIIDWYLFLSLLSFPPVLLIYAVSALFKYGV